MIDQTESTVYGVLRKLVTDPLEMLVRRWNWKSSFFSSIFRALVFFFANLAAGWQAASGAMLAEFVYRAISAGFYGSLTQAFRNAQPAWAASLSALVVVPLVSHSIELAIHLLRHTPKIKTSIISSIVFTLISTLFNVYAMRRGVLVCGRNQGQTILEDLKQVPRLIAGFVSCGPLALYRWLATMQVEEL
ncbi:MAG TPA: hypothetical protein VKG25_00970 [Bryobacteraceae bacterium]|nr:hypothetical protein [Bryobacteraceae bacterium]